jgi:hypothetical protein
MPIGARLKESRILLDSINGLKEILGIIGADFGKPPIPVVVVPSTWLQREIQQQFGEIKYPFIGISLQRFARNTESYNDNLRRIGIPINQPGTNKINNYKLVPIIANFRVRYLTQNFDDLLAFSSRWLLRQKDIQFALGSEEFTVKIKVKLNEDLTMPDQENNDWGLTFQLETDLDMQTYIGELEVTTKINKIVLTPSLWSVTDQKIVASEPGINVTTNNGSIKVTRNAS